MKKLRLFIIFIIFLMMSLISSQAAFWHKDNDLGNDIQKEEYPDSRDVEPKKESDDSMVIQGSVENTVDISLEECMKHWVIIRAYKLLCRMFLHLMLELDRYGHHISRSSAGKLAIQKLNSCSYLTH